MKRGLVLLLLLLTAASCASMPETHFYQLSPAELPQRREPIAGVLGIEPFEADAVYADDRIVYRTSPYSLRYYNYHRWVSPPALHVTDALRDAYSRTGLFRRVVTAIDARVGAVLSGRLLGFEEIDLSETEWRARLELELHAIDPRTGETLWSGRFREEQPLEQQNPEGLAAALSKALRRVVDESAPAIARAMQAASRPELEAEPVAPVPPS